MRVFLKMTAEERQKRRRAERIEVREKGRREERL